MRAMRTCHLFAGAGGGLLADLILGHEPVIAVEWESHACEVLRRRATEGWFPGMRVYEGDVRMFDPSEYAGRVDCIHAGFPCQSISLAGKREGVGEGTRSGLYREVLRVADAIRPQFLFLENVAAIASGGAGEQPLAIVAADLAARGFDAVWMCLAASDVGAPHQRNRWWCLAWRADADGIDRSADCGVLDAWSDGRHKPAGLGENVADAGGGRCCGEGRRQVEQPGGAEAVRAGEAVADASSERQSGQGMPFHAGNQAAHGERQAGDAFNVRKRGKRPVEPDMGGMVDGLAAQVDVGWWLAEPQVGRVTTEKDQRRQRLMELGNGQVPLQAAAAFTILWQMMEAACKK